ncbi:hypothetical protein ACN263_19170 [Micromonospora sp. WMMD729]|uniref:hypothetical protein n=1 Tax=Micromonospora sp. WMMD729 TaxID=3404127 RepID=UPI003BF6197E
MAAAVLATCAGLATWLGGAAIGGELAPSAALRGAWNILPLVLLSLGAASFAVGWMPRLTMLLGGVPTIGGFLLLVIAESVGAPDWVRDISPFAHLAPVPLTNACMTVTTVMLALATLLTALGVAGYRRRDLRC